MKIKYSHLIIWASAIIAAMALSSCGENEIIVSGNTDAEEETKLDIDSISSHFKFEYTYNEGVVELTDEQLSYVDLTRGEYFMPSSIYLKPNTPKELIPAKGTIMVVFTGNDVFPFGLMSKVNSVTQQGDGILLDVSDASLEEVYKDLDMDIKLNAEQLRKLKYAKCEINEPNAQSISEYEFFKDAPSCHAYYNETASVSYLDTKSATSPISTSEESDSQSPKKLFERVQVNLAFIDDGAKLEIKVPSKDLYDKNKQFSLKFGSDGYIKYKPITIEPSIKITNSQVDLKELGFAFNIAWNIELFIEAEYKKFGELQLLEAQIPLPIPDTPIALHLLDKISAGFQGKVKLAGGSKDNFTVYVPKKASDLLKGTIVDPATASTDFNFMKMLLKTINTFEIDGSLFFENKAALAAGATAPESPGAGIGINNRYQIGGKFNYLDPDNFKNNPGVSLDAILEIPIFYAKDLSEFDNYDLGFTIFKVTNKFGTFPIFPQLDNINGVRKTGSPTADLYYETSPWYLLAPVVAANGAKLNISFASSKWIDNPIDGYIIKTVTPEVTYTEGVDKTYKASISNLSKNESYCAVPRFELLGGITKLYGNPIPLVENQVKRLALIGPSFGAKFDNGDISIALGYDGEGRVKTIINKMDQIESRITRNPLVITQQEYEFDDKTGAKIYDVPMKITNIVLDEKSGVIKSGHWYDNVGNVKFYYDDQYHLTGMAGESSDGGFTNRMEWDSNGDLTSITIRDSEGTITIEYEYGNDLNPQGTWTLATGMALEVLAYGKFIGRAPVHLPKKMTITNYESDGKEVDSYNLSYETEGTVGIGSITNEIWKFYIYGQKYEVSFPYVYRTISISDRQLEMEQNLGITRSSETTGTVDEAVEKAFARLRKCRIRFH